MASKETAVTVREAGLQDLGALREIVERAWEPFAAGAKLAKRCASIADHDWQAAKMREIRR